MLLRYLLPIEHWSNKDFLLLETEPRHILLMEFQS